MALLYIYFLMRLDIRNTPCSLARFVRSLSYTEYLRALIVISAKFASLVQVQSSPSHSQSERKSRQSVVFTYILQSCTYRIHSTLYPARISFPTIISLRGSRAGRAAGMYIYLPLHFFVHEEKERTILLQPFVFLACCALYPLSAVLSF